MQRHLPIPAVLVVSQDGLLRWALYEALTATGLRVLSCADEAHAREVLPQVQTDFALAIIDDDTWPLTRSERDWLHLLSPGMPIVMLAHPNQDPEQGLEFRVKELGLAGPGKVRVNQAGCLDRCEEGPCVVVYPEAVWYTYVEHADIDEIIEEHIRNGRVVERMRI